MEVENDKFSFDLDSHDFYSICKRRAEAYITEKKIAEKEDGPVKPFVPLPRPYLHHGTTDEPDILKLDSELTLTFFLPIIAELKFIGVIGLVFK